MDHSNVLGWVDSLISSRQELRWEQSPALSIETEVVRMAVPTGSQVKHTHTHTTHTLHTDGHDLFKVEEMRIWAANVTSCEVVTAAARWFVVGFYILRLPRLS